MRAHLTAVLVVRCRQVVLRRLHKAGRRLLVHHAERVELLEDGL
jgi:hypothetical protein